MKLLSFLLVALIMLSGFSEPQVRRIQMDAANKTVGGHHIDKSGCCSKNKKGATGGKFCNFCVLCIAFIVPVKPVDLRNFAPVSTSYPEAVQSKLSDYHSECWRPPTV
jgi:hypothetical protein